MTSTAEKLEVERPECTIVSAKDDKNLTQNKEVQRNSYKRWCKYRS